MRTENSRFIRNDVGQLVIVTWSNWRGDLLPDTHPVCADNARQIWRARDAQRLGLDVQIPAPRWEGTYPAEREMLEILRPEFPENVSPNPHSSHYWGTWKDWFPRHREMHWRTVWSVDDHGTEYATDVAYFWGDPSRGDGGDLRSVNLYGPGFVRPAEKSLLAGGHPPENWNNFFPTQEVMYSWARNREAAEQAREAAEQAARVASYEAELRKEFGA